MLQSELRLRNPHSNRSHKRPITKVRSDEVAVRQHEERERGLQQLLGAARSAIAQLQQLQVGEQCLANRWGSALLVVRVVSLGVFCEVP